MDEILESSSNLMQLKKKLLLEEISCDTLRSSTIKDLLEILDWTVSSEKKVIISLCKTVSKRGEFDVLTEEYH